MAWIQWCFVNSCFGYMYKTSIMNEHMKLNEVSYKWMITAVVSFVWKGGGVRVKSIHVYIICICTSKQHVHAHITCSQQNARHGTLWRSYACVAVNSLPNANPRSSVFGRILWKSMAEFWGLKFFLRHFDSTKTLIVKHSSSPWGRFAAVYRFCLAALAWMMM